MSAEDLAISSPDRGCTVAPSPGEDHPKIGRCVQYLKRPKSMNLGRQTGSFQSCLGRMQPARNQFLWSPWLVQAPALQLSVARAPHVQRIIRAVLLQAIASVVISPLLPCKETSASCCLRGSCQLSRVDPCRRTIKTPGFHASIDGACCHLVLLSFCHVHRGKFFAKMHNSHADRITLVHGDDVAQSLRVSPMRTRKHFHNVMLRSCGVRNSLYSATPWAV